MSSAALFSGSVGMLAAYLLLIERQRIGATSLTLVGLILMYGVGFWYFAYAVPDLVDSVVERAHHVFALGFVMFLAGVEAVRWSVARALPAQRTLAARWSASPLRTGADLDHWLVVTGFLVAAYLLLVMAATGKFNSVSSFFALASETARADLRRNAASGGYLYDLLITSLGPFLSALVLLRALQRPNVLLRSVAVALCGAILLARFATLTKSMWVTYLVQLLLTVYVTRSLYLPIWRALVAVLALLAALFVGSWLAFPEAPAEEIALYLLYRIVQISNEVMYQTLYVYPEYIAHAEGLNIGILAGIAGPDVPKPAHTAVAAFFGSAGATFNSMFMSGAWVDFGWSGVAVVSFLVGACVRFYDHLTRSLGKTALGCALAGFAVIPVDQLLATSAQTAMLSGGLVSIPLMVLLLLPLMGPAAARNRPQIDGRMSHA